MNIPKQKEKLEKPKTPFYIPKGPLIITLQGDNVENIKNIEFKIEFNEKD